MNKVENIADDLKRKFKQLKKSSLDAFIVLVDLSDSTQFKTEHPEREWIPRLRDFLVAVESVAKPLGLTISKYLGDGVLLFLDAKTNAHKKILKFCTELQKHIEYVNKTEGYFQQYKIRYKIVLCRGTVYLFSGKDPQGAPVDKVFRIEKFIPAGCIGFSNDFVRFIKNKRIISLGKFSLKGISPDPQEVFVLRNQIKETEVENQIKKLREIELIRQIWLGDHYSGNEIVIVSGYISDFKSIGPDNYTVESGDIEAMIEILMGLGKMGVISKIEVKSAKTFIEADYKKNIICVGGPYYNSITRTFLKEIKSPFIFDLKPENIPLINVLNGKKYYAHRGSTKRIIKDYGFFARFKNPIDREGQNNVILICGIETYGVLGAARTFLPANNYFVENSEKIIRILKDKRKEFFLLTECDVESNNVRPKRIECDDKHLIINYNKKRIKHYQADPPSED